MMHSFETQPGGSIWDPVDPGLEPGRIEEKIEKGKTRCDPATQQDPVATRWLLFFLLKQYRFDLKKN
jgi:hypothetical protein